MNGPIQPPLIREDISIPQFLDLLAYANRNGLVDLGILKITDPYVLLAVPNRARGDMGIDNQYFQLAEQGVAMALLPAVPQSIPGIITLWLMYDENDDAVVVEGLKYTTRDTEGYTLANDQLKGFIATMEQQRWRARS